MYFKLVVSVAIASIISTMGLIIKTQYDTINEQNRDIATYKLLLEIDEISSRAEGKIESINQEYQRRYNETNESNESNDSDDDYLYMDIDWLLK